MTTKQSSSSLLLAVVWPILAAALGSVITYRVVRAEIADSVAQRPPIAVINEGDFVRAQGNVRDPDAAIKKGLAAAEEARDTLTKAGYVVLHARAVAGAPDDYVVPAN